jgi:endonuclease G
MAKKALCVGINDYPFEDCDLLGCVNDANDWASLLIRHFDFPQEEVRLLLDSEATKANIMTHLKDMVENAVPGDLLVFTNSSHGTYLIDETLDEPDKYDEAICPYDFQTNLIVDDEFRELFGQLQDGVNLTVIFDSCHSGTATKALMPMTPDQRRVRFLHPSLLGKRPLPGIRKARPRGSKINADERMNEILLSACKNNQYASEAIIDGDNHGAMTYYAMEIIAAAGYKLSFQELQEKLQAKLTSEEYEQDPQLEAKDQNKALFLFSPPPPFPVVVGPRMDDAVRDQVETKMDKINQDARRRYLRLAEVRGNRRESLSRTDRAQKLAMRRSIINTYDGLANERIIDGNDLFPIAYLQTGMDASSSVCRINLRNSRGQTLGYGTGFLVSPSLILTNNHVLENKEAALYSLAEFNYEDDENFQPLPVVSFRLDPDKFFLTDERLDFSLVGVKEVATNGIRIADFGFLPLLAQKGKILEGEYVSAIQHPKGGPKAVTIRENEVRFLSTDYIHYITDTEPGSSGSPVFNDQWVVVALHHAGVPDPNNSMKWIANEGIQISSIVDYLKAQRDLLDSGAQNLLDELLTRTQTPDSGENPIEIGELGDEWYEGVGGYDESFLGADFAVPLPALKAERESDIAPTKDGKKVLKYTHFSITMSKSRRLAFYTAVNIDANSRVSIGRNDKWYFDTRMDEKFQCGPKLYSNNPFDRGHLTRRQDPNWGTDAAKANADTFHFTNSAPQHAKLNQKTWLDLEDYILNNAQVFELKVSVFTGPVFREDDMVYRGEFKIPAEFWKVVVMVKDDHTLSATAYLQTQKNLIENFEFAYGEYKTYQVPVAHIESLTDIDFGILREHDPIGNTETTAGFVIEGPADIRL